MGKAFAPNGVYKVVRELERFNTVKVSRILARRFCLLAELLHC